MVKLGYMLPTDEIHDDKIKEIAHYHQVAEEIVINMLIDNAYNEFSGIEKNRENLKHDITNAKLSFNKEDLMIISHGLYQAFSHMSRILTSYEKEHKKEAEVLQRKINREVAYLTGVENESH